MKNTWWEKRGIYSDSLVDHHGPWCAQCLEYIANNELEKHHLWQSSILVSNNFFGNNSPFSESWTVPVHKTACHREEIQPKAVTTPSFLKDITKNSLHDIDSRRSESFKIGHLNKALFLTEIMRKKCVEERDINKIAEQAILSFNFTTTSRIASKLIYASENSDYFQVKTLQEQLPIHKQAELNFYIGAVNITASGNYGIPEKGKDLFLKKGMDLINDVESSKDKWRNDNKRLYGALMRKQATLHLTIENANIALEITKDRYTGDGYNYRTSQLCLGWSYISANDYVKSHDLFAEVCAESESWFQKANAFFGWGYSIFLQCDLKRIDFALINLIKSQYICNILGFSFYKLPYISNRGISTMKYFSPSDIICEIGKKYTKRLPCGKMKSLREEALAVPMDDSIMNKILSIL